MAPIVIAHRGASYNFAEHTLAAYLAAIDAGAQGFECDVRLTADNVLVCWHDADLTRTSDSTGRISKMTWAEIKNVDAGSWHRAGQTAKPLLFAELLDLAVSSGRSLSIETKHPVPTAGRVERELAKLLAPFLPLNPGPPALAPFRMMSFSRFAVARWRQLAPSVSTVMLIDNGPLIVGTSQVIGPGVHRIRENPSFVKKAHSSGREVHVWTVDEPSDIALCLELGVDAIITNKPAEVIAAIGD